MPASATKHDGGPEGRGGGTWRSVRAVGGRYWWALVVLLAVVGLYFGWHRWALRSGVAERSSGHAFTRTLPQARLAHASKQRTAGAEHGPSAPPGQPVPILMYHVIADPPAGAPYPELYVDPRLFAQQMSYLHRHGYHAVTLDQVWAYWRSGGWLPAKPVVLSFDDGYLSQYSVAYRLLRRYGWPGVLNLALVHLQEGSYGLTRGRVDRMIAAGWEVDSHTVTHIDLVGLSSFELYFEVTGSRRALQARFHQPVSFFCYPAGKYDGTVIAAVRRAGYLGATTTNPGLATPRSDPFQLNRLRVSGGETPAELGSQLRG